ncbi:MAG: amino acid adenylation domain-containing protein [Deltaproteobacteria bacterium]|nr:amino acid adenylation domain-containing protein [Deltaproteobacteria bacterium]
MLLHELVLAAVARSPQAMAVIAPNGTLSYSELDQQAAKLATLLRELGVRPGDRVGIHLAKSTHSVIATQGALRCGAVYVPVDPTAPAQRAWQIISDCQVRMLITDADRLARLPMASADFPIQSIVVDGEQGDACWEDLANVAPSETAEPRAETDLAYILYTSGSTGTPKGVCISHLNALAYVDWAVASLGATSEDRFSNHAPFHFDLSVLDLYGAFRSGGCVAIIDEASAYQPSKLVEFLYGVKPTIWYSVPSALVMMMEMAGLLERPPPPLKALIFAGEPFPIAQLKRLRTAWSDIPFYNYYGPTETNVCTAARVDQIAEDALSVPIGVAASGDRAWAVKSDGEVAGVGEEGLLWIDGPTVMLGYWGKPPQEGPYNTGDVVRVRDDGGFDYVGRRDHMVKLRGHRVELGDVEAAISQHQNVREVATIVKGVGPAAKLVAIVAHRDRKPSLIELKQFCAARLPRYMIPDVVRYRESLPRTGNGKVDRRLLAQEYSD